MIDLVTAAAGEAKSRSSKRVTAAHLKQAVMTNAQYTDWLSEIVGKVADAPAAGSKAGAAAAKDEDSDEWANEAAPSARKKRAGGASRRRKKEDE
jgi:Dr1-associated corepressor